MNNSTTETDAQSNFTPINAAEERLLRCRDVVNMVGMSRAVIYVRMLEGTFPRPLKITARCARWKLSTVQGWISTLTTDADAK